MFDPAIRAASPDDREEIAALERVARDALVGARGGDRWLATHVAHGGRPAEGGGAWVGLIDEVIVGYLLAERDGDVFRVVDVYVRPEARELGFGDELLAAAVAAGRVAGCGLLEAEALPGDRDTKNLYERAGITARLIVVSTEL